MPDHGSNDHRAYHDGSYNHGSYNHGSYNHGSYNHGSYNDGSYDAGSYDEGSYDDGSYNYRVHDNGFHHDERYDDEVAPARPRWRDSVLNALRIGVFGAGVWLIYSFLTGGLGGDHEPARGAIGTQVEDGEFAFTVTRVDLPGQTLGDGIFAEDTTGQWYVVYVTVENIGDEPRTLSVSNQNLYDTQGREFEGSLSFGMDGASDVFLNDINPGVVVPDAPLAFEVPTDFIPDHIELRDSAWSGDGAIVDLG